MFVKTPKEARTYFGALKDAENMAWRHLKEGRSLKEFAEFLANARGWLFGADADGESLARGAKKP